jgi:hypothetical protein
MGKRRWRRGEGSGKKESGKRGGEAEEVQREIKEREKWKRGERRDL